MKWIKWGKAQKISVIVMPIILAGVIYYYQTKKVGEVLDSPPSRLWELALDQVHQTWKGDIDLTDSHLKKSCPHISQENDNIPSELKGCRRELFFCFYHKRKVGIKNQKDFYPLEVIFPKDFLNDSKEDDNSSIKISLNGIERSYELNDFCRQVELPQGAYWGDRGADKNNRIWHTSDVRYSVDRFLVRNIDIREWTLRDSEATTKLGVSLEEGPEKGKGSLFSPSTNLNPKQMAGYCHFREAEVLASHVRAAVSFHHGRTQESLISQNPPSFNTPPHPFGLRQQDSPQYRFSHSKEGDLEVKKSDCRLIYGKECIGFSYHELFPNSLGWSGVSEIFGGPAEYVVNLKYPRKNLHPSSYYHPLSSKVHQAGVRVYWSGGGNRRIDFNFFTEPFFEVNKEQPEDHFDVGFRCMKKRLVRL